MTKTWNLPGGNVYTFYQNLSDKSHVLIGGATGSGKSVLLNGLMWTMLAYAPCQKRFILIDPKRVELIDYKNLPHTMAYASEPDEIITTLEKTVQLMESRFKEMQRQRVKEFKGDHVYVIIDEFADLMTTNKRQTEKLLCRIAQLGRAAHIHLILATQRPTSDIISGQIKVNIDTRIALRCPTARDSKNIIDTNGAELLPKFGQCLLRDSADLSLHKVPYYSENEIMQRVNHWENQTGWFYRKFQQTRL